MTVLIVAQYTTTMSSYLERAAACHAIIGGNYQTDESAARLLYPGHSFSWKFERKDAFEPEDHCHYYVWTATPIEGDGPPARHSMVIGPYSAKVWLLPKSPPPSADIAALIAGSKAALDAKPPRPTY
jgi:hypothetical protein